MFIKEIFLIWKSFCYEQKRIGNKNKIPLVKQVCMHGTVSCVRLGVGSDKCLLALQQQNTHGLTD